MTVRATEREWLDALRWYLEPFRRPAEESWSLRVQLFAEDEEDPDMLSYFRGVKRRLRSRSLAEHLAFATYDLNAAVTENVRDFLLVHSGAVSRGGGGVLIPAKPDVGKSSLVAALLARGSFAYLSDEVAAVDPVTSDVWPYARTMAFDDDALERLPGITDQSKGRPALAREIGQRLVRSTDLGAPASDPVSVRLLVFPTMDREGPPRLQPIARADAVERMASLSFNLYRFRERGVVLLSRVAQEAQAYEMSGGTPSERAELLEERLAG